jgi:2-oxoglutarate dehydrogenase E2 component (dihydrolipoamide succinyltransferase)
MRCNVTVPATADGALSVTITSWIRKVGERVQKGQDLVEATTEKIALYVPAPVDGVVAEILVPEGAKAKVGDVIGVVEGDGDEAGG